MENNAHLSDEQFMTELKRRLDEKNQYLKMQATLISELEDLNEKLRDAEQVKSGFLSNIRNEVNNPLTSIIGLSEQLMSGKIIGEEKIHTLSSIINREAFSLDFQMRNIFAAAEIEAGEIAPHATRLNITELIRQQFVYFKQKSAHHEVVLTYSHQDGDQFFTSDAYFVQMVIMNLLSNAITFSNPGGKVTVASEIRNQHLSIVIHDSGKGIQQGDFKHIFERFHQLESGTTKRHQGHGLGLAVVKDMVDALRGELDFQSVEGESTTVTVTLPVLSEGNSPEGLSSGNEVLFSDVELF